MRSISVERTDGLGRPISMSRAPAAGPVVVFTGDPGMGTSSELSHAGAHARHRGDLVYRISASSAEHETLPERFARALGEDWDRLRESYSRRDLRPVKEVARSLAPVAFGQHRPTTFRSPSLGGFAPQVAYTVDNPRGVHQWRMSDLTDRLAALNKDQPRQFTLLIDNLDAATEKDLVDLNDLADHLAQQGDNRRVQVVAAGSDRTLDRLMDASRGPGGIPSRIPQTYDHRRCLPLSHDQMNQVVTGLAGARNTTIDPMSRQILIDAANGNPGLLTQIHDQAQQRAEIRQPPPAPQPQRQRWFRRRRSQPAQQPTLIDRNDVFQALQTVRYRNEFTFNHQLSGRETEKDHHESVKGQTDLLKAVAWHGRDGMPAAGKENIDQARTRLVKAGVLDEKSLGAVDESRGRLVSAGVLRTDDHGTLTFANPLMLDHFRTQQNLGPNLTAVSAPEEAYHNRKADRERVEHYSSAQPTAETQPDQPSGPDPVQAPPDQTRPEQIQPGPVSTGTEVGELRAGSSTRGMTAAEAGVMREVIDAGNLGGDDLQRVRTAIGDGRFDYAADSLISDGWLDHRDGKLALASGSEAERGQSYTGRHRAPDHPARGAGQGDLNPSERQVLRAVLDSTERGRPLAGRPHQDLVATMGWQQYQQARVGLIDRELVAPPAANASQRAAMLGMGQTHGQGARQGQAPSTPEAGRQRQQGGRHRATRPRPGFDSGR